MVDKLHGNEKFVWDRIEGDPREGAAFRVLVIGGSGRLGRILRRAWRQDGARDLIWQARGPRGDFAVDAVFDPLADADAYMAAAEGADAILNLAGVVRGDEGALALNTRLAIAALGAARGAGVPWVFLASSAAVYGAGGGAHCEGDTVAPVSPYGRAKRAMERAAEAWCAAAQNGPDTGPVPGVTTLRIANVAGADQLLGRVHEGPQPLDLLAGGQAPRRSYIGPAALAAQLTALFVRARDGGLPPVLNLALNGAVAMDALLQADGRDWVARPAPEGLIPEVRLDTRRLAGLIGPVPQAHAEHIVADMRRVLAMPPSTGAATPVSKGRP